MRYAFRRRPSSSMLVAIAALILALTGSAVAGVATISKLTKSDKRKIRKIADREIDAKAPGLSVKSAGDVTNQMWAVVSANASLVRATGGITGVSRDTTGTPGRYVVTANRDLSNCYPLVSLGGSEPDVGVRGDVSVNPINGAPNQLYVLTSNANSPPLNEDRAFTLLVRC
jgi:hypothetical protein